MMCKLSDRVLQPNSAILPQMQTFVQSKVYPHINSDFGYLRAKSLELISCFSQIELLNLDELLGVLLQRLDDDLPVRVCASRCIGSILKYEQGF